MITLTNLEGRTLYIDVRLAQAVAEALAADHPTAEFEVVSTGMLWAIRGGLGGLTGWIYDGEPLRECQQGYPQLAAKVA